MKSNLSIQVKCVSCLVRNGRKSGVLHMHLEPSFSYMVNPAGVSQCSVSRMVRSEVGHKTDLCSSTLIKRNG
jgi:hypothetical protein